MEQNITYNLTFSRFENYVSEYISNHYVECFDDINVISGSSRYPNARKYREYIRMEKRRLYEAVKNFDAHFFPGIKVLDIGCFPGMLLRLLRIIYKDQIELAGAGLLLPREFKDYFTKRYSVDFSDANLDPYLHRNEIDQLHDVPCRLKWPDRYFDFIFATEIIEHLFTPTVLLSECARVLKDSAKLYLTTNNLTTPSIILQTLLGGGANGLGTSVEAIRSLWRPHVRYYNLAELKRHFMTFGFRPLIARHYDDQYQDYWNESRLKAFTRKVFLKPLQAIIPYIRPNLLILAEHVPNTNN